MRKSIQKRILRVASAIEKMASGRIEYSTVHPHDESLMVHIVSEGNEWKVLTTRGDKELDTVPLTEDIVGALQNDQKILAALIPKLKVKPEVMGKSHLEIYKR